MTETEFSKEFVRRLGCLAAAMGAEVSKERLRAYLEFFRRQDHEAALRAIDSAFGACRFFPQPVELVALMDDCQKTHPDAAWAGVLLLLDGFYGMEGHYALVDGATAFAIRGMGGYAALAHTPLNDLPYLGKRFKDLYLMATERGLHRDVGRVDGPRRRALGHEGDPLEPLAQESVPESILPPEGAALRLGDGAGAALPLGQAMAMLKEKMGSPHPIKPSERALECPRIEKRLAMA